MSTHSNMGVAVNRLKQNHSRELHSVQEREDRDLRDRFVAIPGALPSRPEPRQSWDNVASPGRANHKAREAVQMSKNAARVAVATGVRKIMEYTQTKIRDYFTGCADYACVDLEAALTGSGSLIDARVRASKETTEALHEIAILDPRHVDDVGLTVREIDEAIESLAALRSTMVASRAPLNRRPALALS